MTESLRRFLREEFNKNYASSRPKRSVAPKRTSTSIEVGQAVRVVSGPLADFDGQVSEVLAESGKIKVMLTIFGRETPVELTVDQVNIIS